MAVDSIAAAKLAIYIVLVQPAIFCLWKHGKTGFLGWFYVQTFCILRIVTGAIGLKGSTGTVALVINSIGISPLLLATTGVFREVRRAMQPRLNRRLDLILEIQFHVIVSAGLVLIIVPIVKASEGTANGSTKTLLDIGSALTALTWGLLVAWVVFFLATQRVANVHGDERTMRGGRILFKGVLVAIPLVAVRLGYALASLQLRISHPTSGFLTSKAVNVCLNMLPEMLCVVALLAVGLITTSLRLDIKKRDEMVPVRGETEMEPRGKGQEHRRR